MKTKYQATKGDHWGYNFEVMNSNKHNIERIKIILIPGGVVG